MNKMMNALILENFGDHEFKRHCCKQGSESMIFPSKKLRDRKLYLLAKLLLEYYRYKIMKLVLCVEHA